MRPAIGCSARAAERRTGILGPVGRPSLRLTPCRAGFPGADHPSAQAAARGLQGAYDWAQRLKQQPSNAARGSPQKAAHVDTAAAARGGVRSTKPVAPVSAEERELVHLLVHLSALAASADTVTGAQLIEHRLTLVTTSATCDALLAAPFAAAAASDADAAADGDGMAPPGDLVRAYAERAASVVGAAGADRDAGWTRPRPGGSAAGPASALHALTAQSDSDGLAGSGGGGGGGGAAGAARGALSRVAALQRGVSRAAAAAVKAGAPLARSTLEAAAKTVGRPGSPAPAASVGPVQRRAGSPAPPDAAAAGPMPPRAEARAHPNAAWAGMETDDEGAQEGPSPQMLAAAAAAAVAEAAAAGGGARAAPRRAPAAYAAPSGPALPTVYSDPASRWLVADAPDTGVRHIVISAPPALEARFGRDAASQRLAANSDLVTFESYSLRARANRALHAEALALYGRLLPLVLDHLQDCPSGRVCLSGEGLGGSLAALATLMLAHRGLRHSALAPAVALNAPPVLVEVPDVAAFCPEEGCSLDDVGAMLDDAAARGVLARLGLPRGAVLNVFFNRDGRAGGAAAAAAAASVSVSAAPGGAGAGGAAGAALRRLDSALASQFAGSALVPEALKSWLHRASGADAALQILNPVGRILWYEPAV
ncbi:hypothetical protein Rsub_08568 [Raphidocelis subcapitata]|uniref:Fungal lipase-like domain-containing protein n=1 Tax=Raphidocelis subcapitata TaxID=307507 RepID=A0A2V0PEI7_9CHLO|nr:hypothetical protein Rsub_08568 [Raphidocelis subcapitata]|eukprot:GBF95587.1 hypothetical protein Rsub_08568 [Raphidocelis subcapitata]